MLAGIDTVPKTQIRVIQHHLFLHPFRQGAWGNLEFPMNLRHGTNCWGRVESTGNNKANLESDDNRRMRTGIWPNWEEKATGLYKLTGKFVREPQGVSGGALTPKAALVEITSFRGRQLNQFGSGLGPRVGTVPGSTHLGNLQSRGKSHIGGIQALPMEKGAARVFKRQGGRFDIVEQKSLMREVTPCLTRKRTKP